MPRRLKKVRAAQIRDHVIPFLSSHGASETIECTADHTQDAQVVGLHLGDFHLTLATPLTKKDIEQSKKPLPWGMNIWYHSKKKMNIQWDNSGQVIVASLRPGDWENELLSLTVPKVESILSHS